MHILIFIHSLSSGGAERVTATLANHWAEQGWTVTMVWPEPNCCLSPLLKWAAKPGSEGRAIGVRRHAAIKERRAVRMGRV